jgi:flagellar FliL protein
MRLFSLLLLSAALLVSVNIAAASETKGEEKAPPLYYKLSPSLIANVHGKASYVRCNVQLMTRDEEHLEKITHHTPALRHELLLLLGDQDGQKLKATKGKEKLRKAALRGVRKTMKSITGDPMVEDLYFTSYFVQ